MDAATHKTVLTALTQRSKNEVTHPVLGDKVSFGLLPHIQASVGPSHSRRHGGLSRSRVEMNVFRGTCVGWDVRFRQWG